MRILLRKVLKTLRTRKSIQLLATMLRLRFFLRLPTLLIVGLVLPVTAQFGNAVGYRNGADIRNRRGADESEDSVPGNDILKPHWKTVSKNKEFEVKAQKNVFGLTGDKVNSDTTQLGSVATNIVTVAKLQTALDEVIASIVRFSEIPEEQLQQDLEKDKEKLRKELKYLLVVARAELIKVGLQRKDELLELYVDFARVVPPGELARLQANGVYFEMKLSDFLDGFPERFSQWCSDIIIKVLKDVHFLKGILSLRNDEKALGELGRLIDNAMDGEKGIEEARLQILRGDLGVVEFFCRREVHTGMRKYFQILLQDRIAWKLFIMELLDNWPNDAFEGVGLLKAGRRAPTGD